MTPSAAAPRRPSDDARDAPERAEPTSVPEGDPATVEPGSTAPERRRSPRRRRTGIDLFALLYPEAFGPAYAAPEASAAPPNPLADDPGTPPPGSDAAMPAPEEAPPMRIAARALVAVMLCDGVLHPQEQAFVDDLLVRRGQEPLAVHEIRPWRPTELPVPERPEEVLEALAALTYIDGERDPAEWRLVAEFARAWRVGPDFLERLERSFTPSPRGAFRRLLAVTRRWIEIPGERRP